VTANADRHLNRSAALASLAALIPMPLVDSFLENRVRRAATRGILTSRNVVLPAADIATLSDLPSRSWKGAILALLTWPVRKLFRMAFFVFDAKRALNTRRDVVRRGDLLREALDYGLLPGDTAAVRERLEAV